MKKSFRFNKGKYGINKGHVALSWEKGEENVFIDSLNRFISVDELKETTKMFPEDHQNKIYENSIYEMLKNYYKTKKFQKKSIIDDDEVDELNIYPVFTIYNTEKVEKFIVKKDYNNELIQGILEPGMQSIIWLPVFDKDLDDLVKEAETTFISEAYN